MTAALVAAGLGIIPGTAQAADPVPVAAGVAEAIAKASTSEGFHSPADRTIRTTLPGAAAANGKANAKAAAPQTAQATVAAADAGANPALAVDVSGTSYTAHGIELTTLITSADFALGVVIDWGDGKTDTLTAQGTAELHHSHTYDKSGEYQVKVTVTDTANAVQAVNGGAFLTPGSDFTRTLRPASSTPATAPARPRSRSPGSVPSG